MTDANQNPGRVGPPGTDRRAYPYGFCPKCGLMGIHRERGPNGNDRCAYGHEYPSRDALPDRPTDLRTLVEQRIERFACSRRVMASPRADESDHAYARALAHVISELRMALSDACDAPPLVVVDQKTGDVKPLVDPATQQRLERLEAEVRRLNNSMRRMRSALRAAVTINEED